MFNINAVCMDKCIPLDNNALTGLEIKKIFRWPCGDQPEKYSRQMQICSRQFVKCKGRSS